MTGEKLKAEGENFELGLVENFELGVKETVGVDHGEMEDYVVRRALK